MLSTTLTEMIRSKNSVAKSASVASSAVIIALVFSQPSIRQFFSLSALPATGRKLSATEAWTKSVSAALQTPVRCVLALIRISFAMSKSALSST